MIKLRNDTPKVYYEQSRDFQFIGRLFDLMLNAVKTESDLLYQLPIGDENSNLIDLLALTLGFKSKHNYNIKHLFAICKVFPYLLRNKGNLKAIKTAVDVLLHSEGLAETSSCTVKDGILTITVPQALTNINLLRDLFNYILPAGMSCNIIRGTQTETKVSTKLNSDHLAIYEIFDNSTNSETRKNTLSINLNKGEGLLTNTTVIHLDEKPNGGHNTNESKK